MWGGAILGVGVGLGVGFGLEPEVRDARFVESAGVWGLALASAGWRLTDLADDTVGGALGLAGLNTG